MYVKEYIRLYNNRQHCLGDCKRNLARQVGWFVDLKKDIQGKWNSLDETCKGLPRAVW